MLEKIGGEGGRVSTKRRTAIDDLIMSSRTQVPEHIMGQLNSELHVPGHHLSNSARDIHKVRTSLGSNP